MNEQENLTGQAPSPPRFTPKRLDELAGMTRRLAAPDSSIGATAWLILHEAANALEEAAKVAQLHENLAFVLMQIGERSQARQETALGQQGRVQSTPVGWCSECGALQYQTPAGPSCQNGHGGAPTLADQPKRWP